MHDEVRSAPEFYASDMGAHAARLLRTRLLRLWPDLSGLRLLGLGYASPFLSAWDDKAMTVSGRLDSTVTRPDKARHLDSARVRECVVTASHLPFDDLSFDRVLLIHALENTESAQTLLRAVWKVLRDEGKLLLVVPNRRSVWALNDATPFGQGTPFSYRQVARRLQHSLFHVERRETGLFPPPFRRVTGGRVGNVIERAGSTVLPALGGALIVEAVKDQWSGHPLLTTPGRVDLRRQVLEAG